MRLTDRLLAAIYRALRNAENREFRRRYHVETESVPGTGLSVQHSRKLYVPSPAYSKRTYYDIVEGELVPVPHDGRPSPFGYVPETITTDGHPLEGK